MTYNDEELIQITESLKQEWLDKACKWLERNFNMPNDFEYHFRKAMEE